jgi:hypothetical protein
MHVISIDPILEDSSLILGMDQQCRQRLSRQKYLQSDKKQSTFQRLIGADVTYTARIYIRLVFNSIRLKVLWAS